MNIEVAARGREVKRLHMTILPIRRGRRKIKENKKYNGERDQTPVHGSAGYFRL